MADDDTRAAMGWGPLRPVFEFLRDSANGAGVVVVERQLAIPLQFQDSDRSAPRKRGNPGISRNPACHM